MRGCSPDDHEDDGEADGGGQGSRRVVGSPESVAEVAAAARARRRRSQQHLQGTRASELGVRRRTATRGSELSKREGQWLTGAAGIRRGDCGGSR